MNNKPDLDAFKQRCRELMECQQELESKLQTFSERSVRQKDPNYLETKDLLYSVGRELETTVRKFQDSVLGWVQQ